MGQLEEVTVTWAFWREIAENGEETSVYGRLRREILSGALNGNERPKVSTLAARDDTSINPVHEALQRCRGEGFVVISPNRGARVRTIDEAYVRDIYEIAVLIEPYLMRSFVGQCSAADVVQLEPIQREIERLNFVDIDRHSRLDGRFHLFMYDRHHNRNARALWWKHGAILRTINVDHGTSLRRQRDVIDEHRAHIAAVKDHEEDRAAIIARHVQGSGSHITDWMRTQQTPV